MKAETATKAVKMSRDGTLTFIVACVIASVLIGSGTSWAGRDEHGTGNNTVPIVAPPQPETCRSQDGARGVQCPTPGAGKNADHGTSLIGSKQTEVLRMVSGQGQERRMKEGRKAAASSKSRDALARLFLTKGAPGAPVTIVEFSDFQCPFCARVAPLVPKLLEAYPGEVRFIFKHSPLAIHPDAPLAHEAALAAAAQGKFWEMHDMMFANQSKLKHGDLLRYAGEIGLDMPSFTGALQSRRYRPWVEHDLGEAKGLGVTGTPTFFINGRKLVGARSLADFQTVIDQILGRQPPSEVAAVVTIETAGSPVQGPEDALVTIVEFSDLQCPFCARVNPTLKQVLKQYPDQVRWVFKHFPLDFHRDAPLAHQATLAAGEQGKFWEMHDLIFADQSSMQRVDLVRYAEQLGLDRQAFLAALDSERHRQRIAADKAEGTALGVTGTPTFFINGRKLVGAKPLNAFKGMIRRELDRHATAAPSAQPVVRPSKSPPVAADPSNAEFRITVYGDFRSPLSAQTAWVLKRLALEYPGQVEIDFKHYPLDFHPDAGLAHQAALAAGEQGQFWEMHDRIFATRGKVTKDKLVNYAKELRLDLNRFRTALDSGKHMTTIQQDIGEGKQRGVYGVPTLFLNGTRIEGLPSLERLKALAESQQVPSQETSANDE